MSRAFLKDGDGARDPLPDVPRSPHPNDAAPRGLAPLHSRQHLRQTALAALKSRADRREKRPEAAAERDRRHLEARLRSAIPVGPAPHPLTKVAFGLRARVADAPGQTPSCEITGEDEANPAHRSITPHSSLARALLDAEVGDTAPWAKPSGASLLTVVQIECPNA